MFSESVSWREPRGLAASASPLVRLVLFRVLYQ
jgi:hypothetical protein